MTLQVELIFFEYLAQNFHSRVQQFACSFVVNSLRFVVNHGVFTHYPKIHLQEKIHNTKCEKT